VLALEGERVCLLTFPRLEFPVWEVRGARLVAPRPEVAYLGDRA
jgi:hypothetical protein